MSKLYTQTNVPVEISFTSTSVYNDIFNEIEVDVIFTSPSGKEWKVPAFWAGDNIFRVRFSALESGLYTYRSICSNLQDSGLHARTGEIEITQYTGERYLYKHGRLRVAPTMRTLEHTDSTPFFWMGDTWWMGLVKRLDWPHGFKSLTANRVSKGFSLIQIVAGPLPDFDAVSAAFHPQQANEAGWSWETDWSRINPAFYDLADLRIAHLVESGLVPCIVGMWGYYLLFMGEENAKKHWRNLVARYGAYPVVWCIAGEVKLPTYSRLSDPKAPETDGALLSQGWTNVGRYLRETDPYSNPVTAHPWLPMDSRDMLLDESVTDMAMLQTGHSSFASLKPSVETVNAAVARNPRVPVVNAEVCYEGIMGSSWQEVQRFLFWTSLTSGSAGHTYGAQGMWAMSSRDEPFTGTTMNWGDGFWQDVMHYPGSAQVALGRKFFERYPWHLFEPRHEPEATKVERISAFATGIPGAIAVFYLSSTCMDSVFHGMQYIQIEIEPDASYEAFFFNPRTAAEVKVGSVEPNADGKWPTPTKPSMEDWILILQDKAALEKICETA